MSVAKAMRGLFVFLLSVAAIVTTQRSTAQRNAWSEVAAQYRGWVRMSTMPNINRLDCPFADGEQPTHQQLRRNGMEVHRVVRSNAAFGNHAQKLYFIYVSDVGAYANVLSGARRPVEGLTVVKESFRPADLGEVRGTYNYFDLPSLRPEHHRERYEAMAVDGRLVGVGEPIGLFTMRYQRGEWRFATVNFDGTIEASGEMPRCATCHQSAPHHGLFGPHG
ncbi:MAG: hypothetical protein AAGE52_22650 [Myxococcota bacterium]